MEHLTFMLWILLYPICCTLSYYIQALRYKVTGSEQNSDTMQGFIALIDLVIYVFIACIIY
jgi:hypothetical protein